MLAIASHILSDEIGSQYFQEVRPTELFRDCTVFCEMVLSAEQMLRLLEIAMRTAIEKRGVAVLVMASDTALEDAVDDRVFTVLPHRPDHRVHPGGAAGGRRHAELLRERDDPGGRRRGGGTRGCPRPSRRTWRADRACPSPCAYDGPALVSIAVERQELSMLAKIDAKQASGFAVYTPRTALAGNGRELVDLARANARQLL